MSGEEATWPLSLDEVSRIVRHLLTDGTRDGLILANLVNTKMGASARRQAGIADAPPYPPDRLVFSVVSGGTP